jgi:hypothetical protein
MFSRKIRGPATFDFCNTIGTTRKSAHVRGNVGFQGVTGLVSIVKGYSRVSQPFLIARLTRAKHDSCPGRWCSAGEWEDIMKTRYTVVLSMIAGAAVGAAAIQGLHAQAKPKAYLVT